MKAISAYREIVPKKRWFANLITRLFFFTMEMAMQTASSILIY